MFYRAAAYLLDFGTKRVREHLQRYAVFGLADLTDVWLS